MKQYYAIKDKHPDALLFFRLGDFYEMFEDDAKTAAEVLGITLTARNHGGENPTPLAGVPYHSAETYLAKLLKAGIKVAVCEQIGDPRTSKGIVERQVTELHTPGTITEWMDDEKEETRYILSVQPEISEDPKTVSIAVMELLTGEFWTRDLKKSELFDELQRVEPKEIVFPDDVFDEFVIMAKKLRPEPAISYYPHWHFQPDRAEELIKETFGVEELAGLTKLSGLEVQVTGGLLAYIKALKMRTMSQISMVNALDDNDYLVIDSNTLRNLELVRTIGGDKGKGTFLHSLDETKSPMGKRLIRNWIIRPLVDRREIDLRLSAVAEFLESGKLMDDLGEILTNIGDLERLAGRLGMEKASPRDLLAISDSLGNIPVLLDMIKTSKAPLLEEIKVSLDPLTDIRESISETIRQDAPLIISTGNLIKKGIHPEIDELTEIIEDGDSWIRSKEEEIRQKTGITKLKIKQNKVFGYFIEISKAQSEKVPDYFIRKQTLVNQERFITPELKEIEVKIMNARERIVDLERDFFISFRKKLSASSPRIRDVSGVIARLDVILSFAFVSRRRRFVRPKFNDSNYIRIVEGRHPVVEDVVGETAFVPNNTFIDSEQHRVIILTGPNMSGKSTYLRQVALISIMAQLGCFVPAEYADLSIVDRLFCRVGASDNIVLGRSTFLTEMIEAAHILNNATPRSLVLLDEIGRGTSTFDGLSLAWAITEYLHNESKRAAKTIFATHYHEMTALEGLYTGVRNFQVMVKKNDEEIQFMHRITEGGCDDSYGIYVAKLAGLPERVLIRASEILKKLERGETPEKGITEVAGIEAKRESMDGVQLNLFEPEYHPMVIELKELNVDDLTPRQALDLLYAWHSTWGRKK